VDKDLRQSQRTSLFLEVDYEFAGSRAQARISDISVSGLFIDTLSTFPLGSTLKLSFTLPGDYRVETEGMVIHSLPTIGMGVSFKSLKPQDARRIREVVSSNHPCL
jgi:hypothetical protein